MGLLDKAKAAASEFATKADAALTQASDAWSSSGEAERLLRDYGLLTWREQHGQLVDPADLTRVRESLARHESAGSLQTLALQTSATPPPGSYPEPPPPGGPQAGGAPQGGAPSGGAPSGGPQPTPPPPPPPPTNF